MGGFLVLTLSWSTVGAGGLLVLTSKFKLECCGCGCITCTYVTSQRYVVAVFFFVTLGFSY